MLSLFSKDKIYAFGVFLFWSFLVYREPVYAGFHAPTRIYGSKGSYGAQNKTFNGGPKLTVRYVKAGPVDPPHSMVVSAVVEVPQTAEVTVQPETQELFKTKELLKLVPFEYDSEITTEFITRHGIKPLSFGPDAWMHFTQAQYIENIDDSYPVLVQKVDGSDKYKSFTIYKPVRTGYLQSLKLVFYFHGSSYAHEDAFATDRFARDLVNKANVAVAFMSDNTFEPISKCYATIMHIAMNHKEYNINPLKISVLADDVGSITAFEVMVRNIRSKMAGTPALSLNPEENKDSAYLPVYHIPFHRLILVHPFGERKASIIEASSHINSAPCPPELYDYYRQSFAITSIMMAEFAATEKNYVEPVNVSNDILQYFPKTLIVTAEYDFSAKEAVKLVSVLRKAHIETTHIAYPKTIHNFVIWNPLKDTPSTVDAMRVIVNKLKE